PQRPASERADACPLRADDVRLDDPNRAAGAAGVLTAVDVTQPDTASVDGGGGRRWRFRILSIALAVIFAAGTLVILDVYVHYRLARYAALNLWGYRGPIVGRKQPGERRILVVGGSTVFGV